VIRIRGQVENKDSKSRLKSELLHSPSRGHLGVNRKNERETERVWLDTRVIINPVNIPEKETPGEYAL